MHQSRYLGLQLFNFSNSEKCDSFCRCFFKAKEVFIASNKEDVKDRLADARDSVKGEISWSRGLLQKLSKQRLVSSFEPRKIQRSLYRPFIKQYLYYDREAFVEMPGKWSIVFPENSTENLVICSSGVGN